MCCCGKPVINGEVGYKWQPNDAPSVRPVHAPELRERDMLLFDEPGRCGGLDAHSHHYRLVKSGPWLELLVRHGGGEESFKLSDYKTLLPALQALDSNARYWVFHALYYAHIESARFATSKSDSYWKQAAAEGRIKTRKVRGRTVKKVWVEPPAVELAS